MTVELARTYAAEDIDVLDAERQIATLALERPVEGAPQAQTSRRTDLPVRGRAASL